MTGDESMAGILIDATAENGDFENEPLQSWLGFL